MVGEVVALAVGIAASPFPVVPAILLLFTAHPRPTALAFLGAWVGGIAAITTVFVLLADVVGSSGDSPRWLSWVRIVAGVVLLAYGGREWMTRNDSDEVPSWMRSIQDATPVTAARLALLLSVANPKVLLLAAAAGLDLGAGGHTVAGEVVGVVVFTAIATISVSVPVLAYVVVGDPVLRPLGSAKDWLLRHSAAVMAVVIVAIGLLLLKNGIAGL